MKNSQDNGGNGELERLARLNPHTQRQVDHDNLIARGLGHTPEPLQLRARFNLGRGAWAGLTGAVASALVLAAVLMPGGGKAHSYYLFTSQGGAMTPKSDAKFGTNYSGALTASMGLMMPAWKANYIAGPGLSDQTGSGHIYQLVALASNKVLAQRLADFVGIDSLALSSDANGYEYYGSQAAADGTPRPDGYSDPNVGKGIQDQPLSTDKYASVSGQVGQASGFNFNDNAAYGWGFCHQGMTPVPNYCADLKKQPLPSLSAATDYAASAIEALGMQTGTSLANTPNGGYLLTAMPNTPSSGGNIAYASADGSTSTGSGSSSGSSAEQTGVTVTGNLVVDGQITGTTSYFYWYEGVSRVASFGGTLAKVVDRGSFDTISAKATLERLNQNYYQGSVYLSPDTKWRDNSYGGGVASPLTKEIWACITTGPKTPVQPDTQSVPPVDASSAPGGPVATSEPAPAPSDSASASDAPAPSESPSCNLQMNGEIPQADITVTRAEDALVQLWDSNGGTWLVPGFNFYDETGYLASAYSVVDGVIDTTPPTSAPMTK
ncbi:MAG: hypothetical protein ACKOWK_03655 [Micrococcales bacterium]